jgi:hypothetical protein
MHSKHGVSMGKLEIQKKISEIQTKISILFLFGFPGFCLNFLDLRYQTTNFGV